MNNKVRNIIIVTLLVAIVVTFHIVRRNATVRGLECAVVYGDRDVDGNVTLLDGRDVDSLILSAYPNLLNTDIKDVDRRGIEKMLASHPYVKDAEVDVTMGGKILVDVTQRLPVVRLFYQGNEYYLSHEGTCMPLSARHYCHVLVGSSQWEEPALEEPALMNLGDTSIHPQPASPMRIWALARFLHDNPGYGELFDQVYVGDKGDLYLVPKLGTLTVIVGDTTLLAEKFANLDAFLQKGINKVGWDTYSTVNLKYCGQVVCTRKKQ